MPESTDKDCKLNEELFEADGEEDVVAWDDVKGQELDPTLVKDARKTEMGFVGKHRVYEYSTVAECRAETGAEPVGTRWLDTNKGMRRRRTTDGDGSRNSSEGPG